MKTIQSIETKKLRVYAAIVASAIAAALLVGCGGNHDVINDPGTVLTRSVTTASGVQLTLSQDKEAIAVGQDVTYTVTITNTTNAPIPYDAADDCSLQLVPGLPSSIALTNTASSQSETIGAGVVCAHVGQPIPEVLAPGASLTGSIKSGGTLTRPGTYLATLIINDAAPLSTNTTAAQPVTLGPLVIVVTN